MMMPSGIARQALSTARPRAASVAGSLRRENVKSKTEEGLDACERVSVQIKRFVGGTTWAQLRVVSFADGKNGKR